MWGKLNSALLFSTSRSNHALNYRLCRFFRNATRPAITTGSPAIQFTAPIVRAAAIPDHGAFSPGQNRLKRRQRWVLDFVADRLGGKPRIAQRPQFLTVQPRMMHSTGISDSAKTTFAV